MILAILLLGMSQRNLDSSIEQALHGKPLSGQTFHAAMQKTLGGGEGDYRHTLGDGGGLLLTTSGDPDAKGHSSTLQIFIWPEDGRNRAQIINRWVDIPPIDGGRDTSYTDGDVYWKGDRLVLAGVNVDGSNGRFTAATSYKLLGGKWKMTQQLIGTREGYASFGKKNGKVDADFLYIDAEQPTAHLQQPHVGPNLAVNETWSATGVGYRISRVKILDTSLLALDRLAALISVGNRAAFNAGVRRPLRTALWDALQMHNSVMSMSPDVDNMADTFKFHDAGPAVQFRRIGRHWIAAHWIDHAKPYTVHP